MTLRKMILHWAALPHPELLPLGLDAKCSRENAKRAALELNTVCLCPKRHIDAKLVQLLT